MCSNLGSRSRPPIAGLGAILACDAFNGLVEYSRRTFAEAFGMGTGSGASAQFGLSAVCLGWSHALE